MLLLLIPITNPWEKMTGCGLMNRDNDNSAPMT